MLRHKFIVKITYYLTEQESFESRIASEVYAYSATEALHIVADHMLPLEAQDIVEMSVQPA